MANPSPLHHIRRKETAHEAERAKGVFASQKLHDYFAIARFPLSNTLHPSEALRKMFCA